MLDFLKANKGSTAGAAVVLIGLLYYFSTSSSSGAPLTVTDSSSSSPVSQNLLVTLSSLHTIKLNDSLFSDPGFQSLTDFGVTIPPQQAGRRNPFSPLSGGTVIVPPTGAAAHIKLPLSGH